MPVRAVFTWFWLGRRDDEVMATDLRVSVLLSVQRALWDLVTPNIRGVAVVVDHPDVVVRFLWRRNRVGLLTLSDRPPRRNPAASDLV